jgi:hypothetical protein
VDHAGFTDDAAAVHEVARTVLDTAVRYSADAVAAAAVSRAVAAGCRHEAFVKALASSLITHGDALRDRAPARAFLSWSCIIVASLDLSAVWTKKVHTPTHTSIHPHTHPSSTSGASTYPIAYASMPVVQSAVAFHCVTASALKASSPGLARADGFRNSRDDALSPYCHEASVLELLGPPHRRYQRAISPAEMQPPDAQQKSALPNSPPPLNSPAS